MSCPSRSTSSGWGVGEPGGGTELEGPAWAVAATAAGGGLGGILGAGSVYVTGTRGSLAAVVRQGNGRAAKAV